MIPWMRKIITVKCGVSVSLFEALNFTPRKSDKSVTNLLFKMTLGNMLSQMGIGTKHVADSRYSEYHSAPAHEQHIYYAYEPHHDHGHSWKPSYHGKKNHAAMSALTLLAFLFFLHILQQCLRDHMLSMQQTPQVMIMTAGREGDEKLAKQAASDKIDKSGLRTDVKNKNGENKVPNNQLTKIKTAQHVPKVDTHSYNNMYRDYSNRTLFPGFVTAGDNG